MLLEDLQVALKVAEFRSITAAAVSLNMRTATASAALKRVEKSLGVELFIRTTRQLRVSSAGEKYLPQCQQALLLLEQAKVNIKEDLAVIDGDLRIALSSDLGRNYIVPWLNDFTDKHVKINLHINISDTNVDFYRDPVDLALRYGTPTDASMYGFKICNVPRILCASTEYLKAHGTPQHPHHLASHRGLFYQLQDKVNNEWSFSNGSQQHKIKMNGNHSSNDADVVRRWCVAGKGLALKSCLDMSNDLLTGNLIKVMPNFKPVPTELWLVFPSRQSITPAARLLREELKHKTSVILNQLINRGLLDKNDIS